MRGNERSWGDELLPRPIFWSDLAEEDQAMILSGFHLAMPEHQGAPSRRVTCYRQAMVGPDNPYTVLRATIFSLFSTFSIDANLQKKGSIGVVDLRGKQKTSFIEALKLEPIRIPFIAS